MNYLSSDFEALKNEEKVLRQQFEEIKAKGLNLNMARGKPSPEQLDLSMGMLDVINSSSDCHTALGTDCRNYGNVAGIDECKRLFGDVFEVDPQSVFVGGNASLTLMFDTISCFMTKAVYEDTLPWYEVKNRKFLCPVPGYDRHFGITGYYDFEMIPIPMLETGPDMDMVEKLVAEDDSIKGIWCVPKYSNPTGITYSDETVRRFAALKPAAKDFRIMWDNAYCIHDVTDTPDTLLNIVEECKKTGNEDLPILFCSTSNITFSGSGVAALSASETNMKFLLDRYNFQTISYDKINMLRHAKFFEDYNGLLEHMKKHQAILAPKFETVINALETQLKDTNTANWTNPNGGYFISVNVLNGTAKRVVELCKEAGVILTDAGATYPYGNDPDDSNIRIAPSFPTVGELESAMDVFCVCAKIAALEKLLNK